ncbi:GNAT family N-acetyltransferase [Salidesulfovibrio onnuriiensis]|uniref:GNAT family N-acetyltransferase n=1 Tax=Salidesulfovibrio onnuriiensis TaxID=2583823 RepID=UPI001650CF77|nr:GNAT family N-acetyltransferase [Salidesulfovibrio onnuriiensis]
MAEEIIGIIPKNETLTLAKIPAQYKNTTQALLKAGATFIDTELTFQYTVAVAQVDPGIEVEIVKQFRGNDFEALASHIKYSRFFLDTDIPHKRAINLWRHSIRNHCQGRASVMAIGYHDSTPAGLVIVMDNEQARELYFVGVLPCFHRKGIASALLHTLTKAHSKKPIRVEALASNIPAINLYCNAGFRIATASNVLHLWGSPKQSDLQYR